jgi:hypothetical protein
VRTLSAGLIDDTWLVNCFLWTTRHISHTWIGYAEVNGRALIQYLHNHGAPHATITSPSPEEKSVSTCLS